MKEKKGKGEKEEGKEIKTKKRIKRRNMKVERERKKNEK